MIDVNTALENILKAIYGKQIRESIHDAIYQINQNANEAVDLAQIRFGTDVTGPTSSVTGFLEGTVYFNVATGIIWKLSGGAWAKQGNMKSIDSIAKTSTVGLVDTYTITYNDGTTTNYNVTNGEKGVSVANITKASTTGNIDHYEVNLSDGSKTPNGFDVVNGIDGADGVSISDIEAGAVVGNTKNYKVKLSDGTYTQTGFTVTDGTSNYVHIRYSASFDGSGMVSVPTATTVYIGICVTTQSNAPSDPAVYSWVKFIGDSGSGSGDMLKTDYATLYPNTVDKAAALYDGSREISASQLMAKADYASKGIANTVDKATELVDTVNSKTADTELLANLTDDGTGLKYKGAEIGGKVDIDDVTIKEDADGKLKVADEITTKLAKLNNKADGDADDGAVTQALTNLWNGQELFALYEGGNTYLDLINRINSGFFGSVCFSNWSDTTHFPIVFGSGIAYRGVDPNCISFLYGTVGNRSDLNNYDLYYGYVNLNESMTTPMWKKLNGDNWHKVNGAVQVQTVNNANTDTVIYFTHLNPNYAYELFAETPNGGQVNVSFSQTYQDDTNGLFIAYTVNVPNVYSVPANFKLREIK